MNLLKLGIEAAESTVAKYMPRHRDRGGDQSWCTFLANEFDGIAAIDLMTVTTITFDRLYALVILSPRQRRLVFVTATSHPTALWLAQKIREAFPWDTAPQFLIRDNDKKYDDAFKRTVRTFGIRDRPISPHSPWQNGFVERVIGTIRRECLDQILILNEIRLRRTLSTFANHYNASRTHLSLGKDAPDGRAIERDGEIVSISILGGLHHRYGRCASAKDSNTR